MSMKSMRRRLRLFLGVVAAMMFTLVSASPVHGQSAKSQFVSREIRSNSLAQSKVGTNPLRKMEVYLPAGYADSNKRYAVIYYLPSPGGFTTEFFEKTVKPLLDEAIAKRVIEPFVLVSVDMATPIGCSWYVNSPVTGNWEDFMGREGGPYGDANF